MKKFALIKYTLLEFSVVDFFGNVFYYVLKKRRVETPEVFGETVYIIRTVKSRHLKHFCCMLGSRYRLELRLHN